MEECPPMDLREDEIDLGKYFAILRKAWWKIGLFSDDLNFGRDSNQTVFHAGSPPCLCPCLGILNRKGVFV